MSACGSARSLRSTSDSNAAAASSIRSSAPSPIATGSPAHATRATASSVMSWRSSSTHTPDRTVICATLGRNRSARLLDHPDELVGPVAVAPGEADELADPLLEDAAPVRIAGHRDAPSAPELEHALLAERPQRAQHGVRVDAEDRGEVPGGGDALARAGLA